MEIGVGAVLVAAVASMVLSALEGAGCPTAAWRGPGSLDGVLSALGRRARAPRVRT